VASGAARHGAEELKGSLWRRDRTPLEGLAALRHRRIAVATSFAFQLLSTKDTTSAAGIKSPMMATINAAFPRLVF
jgi:hypothetical protein